MLKGKTALITGGSRGIGRAIALKLAENGADIAFIYGGNEAAAARTVHELELLGVKAASYKCDISDFERTKAAVDKILEDFTAVDILVNNSGIVRDGLLLSMSEEAFDEVLDVNLKGAFNMTKHLGRHFLKRKSGKIINISSISGLMGNAGQANYSASKAGLIGFTKSVAKELGSRGICCNAIAPGFIETEMTEDIADKNPLLGAIALKRLGKASEVAELAAFLASDRSNYITGEVIRIDGGLAM